MGLKFHQFLSVEFQGKEYSLELAGNSNWSKFTTFKSYHRLSENGEEWTHCAESSFLILLLDGATSSFSAEEGTSSESSNKSLLMSMGLTKSKDLKIESVNII
jgi:hypothetical protein